MSGRKMKNRVLLISAVALVASSFPLMIADAGDGSALMPDGMITGGIVPSLPAAAPVQPALPLPVPAVATVAQPAAPSAAGNPFALAAAPVSSPSAIDNPFARRAAPAAVAADVEITPFALKSVIGSSGAVQVASLTEDVDVTALRYYAGQRDMARVGAETRRLKSLYPSWEPPADLFVVPTTVDEQPLWDLFAQGLYAEERQRIEELKAQNPGWLPSTDLTTKLYDAEARVAMKLAYTMGNWDQVIAVARERSSVLVCQQVDALWELGEALGRKADFATAFDTYKYVLVNCNDENARISTVQKASLILPTVGMNALVMLGRPLPDGTSEFMSIGFDDLRRRLAANVNDRFAADPVTPDEMERFVTYVRSHPEASDVGLIAWYYYAQKEWNAAEAWFAVGTKSTRDDKFIEGQILAMRAAGKSGLALELANEVKERTPELTQQYIELVAEILSDPETSLEFPRRELKSFEKLVQEEESALGAQAVGWRYIEDENVKRAGIWFDRSMEWDVTEGGAIGQAVVASRLKNYKTLKSIKAKYGDEYAELDDFKVYTPKVRKSRSISVRSKSSVAASCASRNGNGLFAMFVCNRS